MPAQKAPSPPKKSVVKGRRDSVHPATFTALEMVTKDRFAMLLREHANLWGSLRCG